MFKNDDQEPLLWSVQLSVLSDIWDEQINQSTDQPWLIPITTMSRL